MVPTQDAIKDIPSCTYSLADILPSNKGYEIGSNQKINGYFMRVNQAIELFLQTDKL